MSDKETEDKPKGLVDALATEVEAMLGQPQNGTVPREMRLEAIKGRLEAWERDIATCQVDWGIAGVLMAVDPAAGKAMQERVKQTLAKVLQVVNHLKAEQAVLLGATAN